MVYNDVELEELKQLVEKQITDTREAKEFYRIEYKKAWREKNRILTRLRAKLKYNTNPEVRLKYRNQYLKKNPDAGEYNTTKKYTKKLQIKNETTIQLLESLNSV